MFPLLIMYDKTKVFTIIEHSEDVLVGESFKILKKEAIASDLKMVQDVYQMGQADPIRHGGGGRD